MEKGLGGIVLITLLFPIGLLKKLRWIAVQRAKQETRRKGKQKWLLNQLTSLESVHIIVSQIMNDA